MCVRKAAVDTNVLCVANLRPPNDCSLQCVEVLRRIQRDGCVLLDSGWLILGEYLRNARSSGEPGPGDAFLRWVLINRTNPRRCRLVNITPHATREYQEFPDSPDLAVFDRDDRQFVAVAVSAGGGASVVVALDTDWWDYRNAFAAVGLPLVFLCPEALRAAVEGK